MAERKLLKLRLAKRLINKNTLTSLWKNRNQFIKNFRPLEYLSRNYTDSHGTHYVGIDSIGEFTDEHKQVYFDSIAQRIASNPGNSHIWVAYCMKQCLPIRFEENCRKITQGEEYSAACNDCHVGYLADRVIQLGANLKTIGSSPEFLEKEIIPSVGNIDVLITAACALATEEPLITQSIKALNIDYGLACRIDGMNTHTCTTEEWLDSEMGNAKRITQFQPQSLNDILYVLDKAIDLQCNQ